MAPIPPPKFPPQPMDQENIRGIAEHARRRQVNVSFGDRQLAPITFGHLVGGLVIAGLFFLLMAVGGFLE